MALDQYQVFVRRHIDALENNRDAGFHADKSGTNPPASGPTSVTTAHCRCRWQFRLALPR